MPYTEDDISEYLVTLGVFEKKRSILENRVDHIISVILKVFKARLGCWYFYNAREGEVGECSSYELRDKDSIEISYILDTKPVDIGTQFWDYSAGFPRRFLFMTDKEITDHIKAELQTEKELKKKRQKEASEKKAKRDRVKKSALAKLTKTERQALGV